MSQVDMTELKEWARKKLPKGGPLRLTIEAQPDKLTAEEFVALIRSCDFIAATL